MSDLRLDTAELRDAQDIVEDHASADAPPSVLPEGFVAPSPDIPPTPVAP